MRRQECVVRVVGISGSLVDDTVAVVVLPVGVWTVPKPAAWNMGAGVILPFGTMMGRLRTRGCIGVSVRCKDSPELGAWSPAGERRDAVAILVVNEAEECAHGTGSGDPCAGGPRRWDALCPL
jgi:hypothetical protein